MDRYEGFFNSITALRGDMFAYAYSITKDRGDAEDAVQNAIVRAYDALPGLRSREKLRPWLMKILRNESLQIVRAGKRFVTLAEDIPAERKDVEAGLDLAGAVAALSHELRETVTLYYKLGCSTGEIARITGVPRGTVMSRLSRARALIKKHIEGEEK